MLDKIIDQIFIYTAPDILNDAHLENPIRLLDDWVIFEQEKLGEDILEIAEKGVACLQELLRNWVELISLIKAC